MTIGTTVSKVQLDERAGQIAIDLIRAFREVAELHRYLLITSDADLVAKGYSDGAGANPVNEVAILKSAFADADSARTTFETLRANLDQVAGLLVT